MTTRKTTQPLILAVCLLSTGVFAFAQAPIINHPVRFAVSPPMSQAPQAPPGTGLQSVIPLRAIPHAASPQVDDPALQKVFGPLVDATPGIQFDGVDDSICNCAPSDVNMAVGPNNLVQTVNVGWAVYDKNGNITPGFPKTLGSIWAALGGACTGNQGDPIVQYDKLADRWFVSQLGSETAPFSECIAVSTTNNPAGTYALYEYQFGNNFPDYPHFGVWPTATNSAYMMMAHLFQNFQTFIGTAACAFDRTKLLAGAAQPTMICFTISNDGGFQPADLDGSTPPPDGSPGYFVTFETSSLHEFQLSPNFANPPASTFVGPIDLPVSAFTLACGGTGGTCVPQSGTTTKLDTLGDRMMYRMAYRNFGDHEAMVVNHSVAAGSGVGVRWYEIRSPLSPTIFQQGTYSPNSTFRWMGSAAMDKVGDIAMGYSLSSSSIHPGIAFTGRIPSDSPGTMQSEATMLTGGGSQNGGLTRWGDYTALRIDPADDCTFWYTNQYLKTNGNFNWSTRIGSFSMNNCTGVAGNPDFTITATPPSQTVSKGGTTTYTVTIAAQNGFTGVVSFTVTGTRALDQETFSPTTVTGSGSTTLTIKASRFGRTGTFPLTITGTSGSLSHTANVTLVIQ
jgi:hypothetical protein